MRKLAVLRGADLVAPLFYGIEGKGNIIGGFVRWMVSPHHDPAPAGDIDIYPNGMEEMADIHSWIYANIELKDKGKKPHMTDLSTSFVPAYGPKIQVINPTNTGHIVAKGSMEQILNNFDFTVCRAGLLDLQTGLVDDEFVHDEMRKRINIKQIHCPLGEIKRIAKYAKKGYYVSPAELYKLFADWDQRSDDYKEELRAAISAWEDMRTGEQLNEDDLETLGSDEVNTTLARLIYVD